MLFEGIGESVEQLVTVVAVVGPIRGQGLQLPAPAQLIQPVTSPGSVVEQSMQIAAGDASTATGGHPPAQAGLVCQGRE